MKNMKKNEESPSTGSAPLAWHGLSGRVKNGIDPAPILSVIGPDPIRDLARIDAAEFVQATIDKGSRVYRAFLDLGAGEEELFIKTFDAAETWSVMARRMFSVKGMKRPGHYPKKFLRMLFEPSLAKRCWEVAAACERANIPVAETLLYLSRGRRANSEEVLVTRGVNPRTAGEAREYFSSNFKSPNTESESKLKGAFLDDLGSLLRVVRESEIMFPDFKIHNLVVEEPPGKPPRFVVIDLSEAEIGRPDYCEFVLLERFIRSFHRSEAFTVEDENRLLKAYLAAGNDSRTREEVSEGIRERARRQGR